ncbi:MAG TPA: histidinol-phosphatase [bacterium]|nr:histidinol-phosphatase [bacterium]
MAEKEQALFDHGSAWLRADFHLHTKADDEFVYQGDDNYYNSSYIDALLAVDIRFGVITNHNKFDFDEFVAISKTAAKRDIYLLPGVELSAGDGTAGIHVNIVFSETWYSNGDLISPFLSTMFLGKSEDQYQNENGRSDKNLIEIVDALDKVGKDYFLVFAHVEDAKGLWHEIKARLADWNDPRHRPLRDRTLGFQKVRTRDERRKVENWLGGWYPAELEGSDCKSIAEIGKGRSCYLKLGAFNFEAVKFALSDYKVRVSHTPVPHKRSYIKSVKIDGGTLDGQALPLAAGLNALIGIRGSGKSSIIEAIRFGLDIPFGEKAQDADYKQRLIKHSLGSGGKITIVAVDSYGEEYEIRRIWEHSPEVFKNGILQPGVSIRESIISKPLYFGQKDLSSSGEGFEKDLVEKLLGPAVEAIRFKIEEQKEKVKQAVQRYKRLGALAERREEQTQKKQNAEFQLRRYKEYGLEDKLQKQIDYDADAKRLGDMTRAVQDLQKGLNVFLAEHEDEVRNLAFYTSKRNEAFFKDFSLLYGNALTQLDSLTKCNQSLHALLPEMEARTAVFAGILSGLKEEFAATERAINDEFRIAGIPAIRTDEFRQLSKAIDNATAILAELDKEQAKADSIQAELLGELSALNSLWLSEYGLIKAEMDKVNAGHSSLSIEVAYKGDRNAFKAMLRDTMRGSSLRETVYDRVRDTFVDPIEVFKDKARVDEQLGSNAPVFWKYFLDNLELMVSWKVPNLFTIKYKGKELKDHSLGQRASALMLFVLSQKEHDVILIDQPEDDLDNQTIYQDVIKLIRELKTDTQFIFATHNPNFPVLGDAEMVVSCTYANDRVSTQLGSIDDKAVQERIVSVMEGGQEAFNRRKEIYGIWKPLSS